MRVGKVERRIAFAQGLDEIPDDVNVVNITRSDLPPEFARLVAGGKVARINLFYRGLMRSLAATGHRAVAMRVFRRCRELLSIVLSIKPSDDTERLYRRISGRV